MKLLEGKTALITGASRGIGKAIAIRYAKEGCNVAFSDLVRNEAMEETEKELLSYGVQAKGYASNAASFESSNELVQNVVADFGRIDILVNNAALWRYKSSFVDTPTDEWRKFLDINIMGTVYFTKAVLPKMLEKNYGRIINVASVAGVYGNANMVHYSATKGAVISMTKGLAKEVADKGITVNAVSPGSVSPSDNPDINYFKPSELSFMGRTGTDKENADLICFLASDEAGYICGQNIQIDGCRKKQ